MDSYLDTIKTMDLVLDIESCSRYVLTHFKMYTRKWACKGDHDHCQRPLMLMDRWFDHAHEMIPNVALAVVGVIVLMLATLVCSLCVLSYDDAVEIDRANS